MVDNTKGKTQNLKTNVTSMADLMAKYSSSFQTLKKGDIVTGTVKKLTPQEILLDIGYKSDALVIEYDKRNLENLLSLLKVGDSVKASVISAESEEGFPVVSLRRMLEDKVYSGLSDQYLGNKTLKARILESTRGGYFVETSEGTKGFLPNSQLLSDRLNTGEETDVRIIEFDREKKRLILSQKATQYLMDPSEIEKLIKKDSQVKMIVTTVSSYGIYGEIKPKEGITIEGFIHISEVSHDRVENLAGMFKTGDELTAQAVDIDRENKRINMSLKKLEKDTFDEVKSKYKEGQTIKATVTEVKSRGITLMLEPGVSGFIASSRIPTETVYEKDQKVEVEVIDFDDRKRLVNVTPVLKAKFIGYR